MKTLPFSYFATPFSLSHDTLPHLRQALFEAPNPGTWSKLTENDLEGLELRCQTHWTRTSSLFNSAWLWLVLALLPAMLATAVTANSLNTSLSPMGWAGFLLGTYLMYGLASSAAVVLGYQVCVPAFGWDASDDISAKLKPLSEFDSACVKAVLLAPQSLSALAYRDSIMQAGRSLRQIDLRIIQALANFDRFVAKRAELKQACQPVHGLELA